MVIMFVVAKRREAEVYGLAVMPQVEPGLSGLENGRMAVCIQS